MLRCAQLLGGFSAAHPDLTRLFFTGGLFLELLAFLLLINRAWATGIGASLIMMHVMVALTMNLYFTMNMAVVLIFLVNVPYWWTVGDGGEGRLRLLCRNHSRHSLRILASAGCGQISVRAGS